MSGAITLSAAEERLIKAAREGWAADLSIPSYSAQAANNPTFCDPENSVVRAEIIRALAIGANPSWPVSPKGVQLAGAKIIGALDFQGVKILYPLVLVNCRVEESIILVDAAAPTISLYGLPTENLDRNAETITVC